MPPGPGAKWSGMAFVRHGPFPYPPHLTPNEERRDQKHPPQTPGPRTQVEPAQTQKRSPRGTTPPEPRVPRGGARPRLLVPQPERPRADPWSSAPGNPLFLSGSYPPAACAWQ